ncbi:MAG: winged helix DNA-binding domain-containing protein [Gemmatimonadaceae bacterium]
MTRASAGGTLSLRDVISRRLAGVLLTSPRATTAAEVVRALGAVQAQDYHGAKWAIAQRGRGLTDATVEREFDAGDLIRTHVLRPTWHFVAPEDARWMLALTGSRIARAMGHYNDVFNLDAKVFRRANDAMANALAGGKFLTRAELSAAIERGGVPVTSSQKLVRLVMRAELDAVICSGPRRGKQFTYALFDERVPPTPALERDEALLTLIRRYFSTRGPATLQDFAWWSGLTVADAKRGVEIAGPELTRRTFGDADHWFVDGPVRRAPRSAMLLPNYDEYFIGYRDRGAVGGRVGHSNAVIGGDGSVQHALFLGGELVGRWKRVSDKARLIVHVKIEAALTGREWADIAAATRRLAGFRGLPVTLRGRRR